MRVIKDLNQAALVKHTNIDSKDYLCISSMLYFDLKTLKILNDSIMWQETMPFLRQNSLLDECYPKAFGEFMAYGHCFNDIPKEANQVSIKVGKVEKKLDVLGDRFYNIKMDGSLEVSKPKEFKQIKVGFENAFGGEEFKNNPLGKGYLRNKEVNQSNIKLHNIDSISHKSANYSSYENIIPQSFEPLEMNWPYRLNKGGVYDENWTKTRWPYFPLDVQKEYFQRTLSDQWSEGYFRGDEEIIIKNMNSSYPLIETSLPKKKIKTFITRIKKEDYYKDEVFEESFFEIESKIDTIILFTDIAKAVVIFRSLVECIDDEYSDIKEVFLYTQDINEDPKELKFYEEIKNQTTSLEFDVQKHEALMKKKLAPVWDIPRLLEHNLVEIPSGNAPALLPSASLIANESIKEWKNMKNTFIDLSKRGVRSQLIKSNISKNNFDLMERYGSDILEKVDSQLKFSFSQGLKNIENEQYEDNMQKGLLEHKSRIKSFFDKFKNSNRSFIKDIFSNDKIPENKKSKFLELEKRLQNENLDELSINSWEDGAKFFVANSQYLLNKSLEIKNKFTEIGLRDAVLSISNMGYNFEDKLIKRKLWNQEEQFKVPKGFIIPFFEQDSLKKVIVRPNLSKIVGEKIFLCDNSNDIIIDASLECEEILLGKYKKNVIIVDDILKAWIINQDLWDISSLAVFNSQDKFFKSNYYKDNKDNLELIITTTFTINDKNIKTLHFDLTNDDFLNIYSSEDFRNKLIINIKDENFKKKIKKQEDNKKKQGLFYIPQVSHLGYQNKMTEILKQKMKYKSEIVKQTLKSNMNIEDGLVKNYINLNKEFNRFDAQISSILSKPFDPLHNKQESLENIFSNISSNITDSKKSTSLDNIKFLDETLEKISNYKEEISKEIQQVEDMKKNGVIPQWMKDAFKSNFDIDLDAPKLIFSSLDEVLEHYKNNKSFKNSSIYNLVLDGLNLSGADFSFSNFDNCSLIGTKLNNSNFTNAILNGTNLSKADLSNSNLKGTKFISTILDEVIFFDSDLSNSLFQGIEAQKVKVLESKFKNTNMINCTFKKSNFDSSILEQILFNNVEFIESSFNNCQYKESLINKCLFKGTSMQNTFLFRSSIAACTFEKVDLSNSSFDTVTFVQKSSFNNTLMQYIKVEKSSLLEAKLIKCDLSNSHFLDVFLNKSFIEEVKLIMCDFENTQITRNHIKNSKLYLSIFMGCSFRKSYFEYVDMTKSSVYQADFWNIKVKQFDLRGSNIKKTILEKDDNIYSLEEVLY